MVFNQIDEEETGLQDRTAFEEFQNALQCVIASFVEYPQVTHTSFHFDYKSKYRKIRHCVFRPFKKGFFFTLHRKIRVSQSMHQVTQRKTPQTLPLSCKTFIVTDRFRWPKFCFVITALQPSLLKVTEIQLVLPNTERFLSKWWQTEKRVRWLTWLKR